MVKPEPEPQTADLSSDYVQCLIELQANQMFMLALRDLLTVLTERRSSAQRDIEDLTQECETTKTFATYRDINALHQLERDIEGLSEMIEKQANSLRQEQSKLLATVQRT